MIEIQPSQIFCGYDIAVAQSEGACRLAEVLFARLKELKLAEDLALSSIEKRPVQIEDVTDFLADLNAEQWIIYRPASQTNLPTLTFRFKAVPCTIRFTRAQITKAPTSDVLLNPIEVAGTYALQENYHVVHGNIITN